MQQQPLSNSRKDDDYAWIPSVPNSTNDNREWIPCQSVTTQYSKKRVDSMFAVKSFTKYHTRIKNVALFLVIGDRVLTVTEIKGKDKNLVGFPAGGMTGHDRSVFVAMKREFEEETGRDLPQLINIRRFLYNNHTAIYVAATRDYFDTKQFSPNRKIKEMRLTKITDIKLALTGQQREFTLRPSVKNSTKLLLQHLDF